MRDEYYGKSDWDDHCYFYWTTGTISGPVVLLDYGTSYILGAVWGMYI
jgi:hypothetical protein